MSENFQVKRPFCLNHATLSCTTVVGKLLIKKSGRSSLGFQARPLIFAVHVEETGHSFQTSYPNKLAHQNWKQSNVLAGIL